MLKSPFLNNSPQSAQRNQTTPSNNSTLQVVVDKEITALTLWLQTFPCFDISLLSEWDPDAAPRLFRAMDGMLTVRAVWKVAQLVCDDDTMEIEDDDPEKAWTSLMLLSSQRARPLLQPTNEKLSSDRLKTYVLSGMLDCAVKTTDKQVRHAYIRRLSSMPKDAQKVIMHIIEQRQPIDSSTLRKSGSASTSSGSRNSSSRRRSSMGGTPSSSSPAQQQQQRTPQRGTPQRSSRKTIPSSAYSSPSKTSSSISNTSSSSSYNHNNNNANHEDSMTTKTPGSSPRAKQTGIPTYKVVGSGGEGGTGSSGGGPTTPVRSNMRSGTAGHRSHSTAFGERPPETGYTPPPKQRLLMTATTPSSVHNNTPSGGGGAAGFLSPGTLESPDRMQNIVGGLKRRNQELQSKVEAVTTVEEGLRQEIDEKDQQYRKKAMKIESEAFQREQELRDELDERTTQFEKDIEEWRTKAKAGEEAQQRLRLALDDLELMQHNKQVLSETTDKMNKFRDKVSELADVKDALAREQAKHGKAIDELARLEGEVRSLEASKRQLDDYKIRAIEAEVKLVECQDYLRRVEQQNSENSATQARLYQGTVMQKEQMEEMISRIQQETKSMDESNDDGNNGSGSIGSGISELNSDIKQQLSKLRTENLQLRAFAAKRQDDAVDELEKELEETSLVAKKYQDDYRATQEQLAETQSLLGDIQQREAKLRVDLDDYKNRCSASEARIGVLEETLEKAQNELQSMRLDLTERVARNEQLVRDVETWTARAQDAEKVAANRQLQVDGLSQDVESCQTILQDAEHSIESLRNEAKSWEEQATKYGEQLQTTEEQLNDSEEFAAETKKGLNQLQEFVASLEDRIQNLGEEQIHLRRQLKEEQEAKEKVTVESEQALNATRQVLEAKAAKDLAELKKSMIEQLEDEKDSSQRREEESNRLLESMEEEWQEKYRELQERSMELTKRLQGDSQTRLDQMKKEHEVELEAARKETKDAKESHDNTIRKGRSMLQETKANTIKELQTMKDELDDLQDQLDAVTTEKDEMENSTSRKIASLQQKLNIATTQIGDYSKETDELQEQIQSVEREKFKLQEDNDRYRRQLGGRYGADGKVQSQLEKLQKEYNTVLEENRNLKKQSRHNSTDGSSSNILSSISESTDEGSVGSYNRGNMSRTTISQLRREYEETIEALNDEKRELVMRNSAATTDVQKAEQRVWEKEQEVSRLQAEVTSLQLQIQRMEFAKDSAADSRDVGPTPRDKELSFFSAHDRSPTGQLRDQSPCASPGLNRSTISTSSYSPSLERAMRQKAQREEDLRNKFTSITGSPFKSASRQEYVQSHQSQVLSPTRRHEHQSNQSDGQSPSGSANVSPSKMSSEVFGLGMSSDTGASGNMVDLMRAEEAQNDMDGKPECKQS